MTKISRKEFIARSCSVLFVASSPAFLSSLFGCKQGYTRQAADLNLGEVKDLLYNQQLVRDKDVLVNRDQQGWSAMSTQCTKEGCALSYQEERFLCTCCGSVYNHSGAVLKGPAERPLPFFEIRYTDGNLFADSGKIVPSSYRFINPELEETIGRLEERIRKEGTRAGSQIPEILKGKGDQTESGPMFEERKLPPREFSSEETETIEEEVE